MPDRSRSRRAASRPRTGPRPTRRKTVPAPPRGASSSSARRTRPLPPAPAPTPAARSSAPASSAVPTAPVGTTPPARRHLLSLSFVRDGDDYLARIETDSGQITELKHRALDQLLTLVAGELEDLLE